MASEPGLPSFARPPLTEVALSVQFEPIPDLNVAVLGIAWTEFREEFPVVESQPPLDPSVERVGLPATQASVPMFVPGFPAPRLWFVSKPGTELVQLQQDRFVRNWRKVGDGPVYPRYDAHIRPRFLRDYEKFLAFLARRKIGPISPNQCELTYVNNIGPGSVWNTHADLSKVLRICNFGVQGVSGLKFQEARLAQTQQIADAAGKFLGRLHMTIEPQLKRTDNSPMIGLTFTVRGQPFSPDTNGVLGFFDLGRSLIVRTFAAITTKEMHKEWGRLDAGS
jgi:uncharacterized protein (TIGR04255 family)